MDRGQADARRGVTISATLLGCLAVAARLPDDLLLIGDRAFG